MTHFIDRRLNGKNKSTVNRQRFLRRYKNQIKKAVADAVNNRSIEDVSNGESISIPTKDILEYQFSQDKGGIRDIVNPGNDRFTQGDKIERPESNSNSDGESGNGNASKDGLGADDFQFQISKDEYLNLLFEDLELPNLEKNSKDKIEDFENRRAGFTTQGIPSNISVVKTLQNSLARRIAINASKIKRVNQLKSQIQESSISEDSSDDIISEIKAEIAIIEKKIASTPFIDTYDLKYKKFDKTPICNSKAVMFCVMDVSGSMDQPTKDMAKRFYILLYMFLTKNYGAIDVVYIRHHTKAKEVNEHDFFYSQETGGTIVSSALKLMEKIINERYQDGLWNIYAAQASDGDNWADDSPNCHKLMSENIIPKVRYYSYIEITNRTHQTLWREYERLNQEYDNFSMEHIRKVEDIYPVFRQIFKKQA